MYIEYRISVRFKILIKSSTVDTRLDSPERRHGDDGIPERLWNAGELGTLDVLLCVVHDGGEDDDGHGEGEEEEAELGGAAPQGVAEDPESLRVPGELEDTEDAEHAEGDERPTQVLVVRDPQADVVG